MRSVNNRILCRVNWMIPMKNIKIKSERDSIESRIDLFMNIIMII